MWRRPFLYGMLCGTLMTAGLVLLVHIPIPSGTTTGPAARRPFAPMAVRVTQSGGEPQMLPPPVPPGWYRYRFNGQMVYVVPLAP